MEPCLSPVGEMSEFGLKEFYGTVKVAFHIWSFFELMVWMYCKFLILTICHVIFVRYISNEGMKFGEWWIECNISKMSDHWKAFWSLMNKSWTNVSWMSNKTLIWLSCNFFNNRDLCHVGFLLATSVSKEFFRLTDGVQTCKV